jgi:hypothetical protein
MAALRTSRALAAFGKGFGDQHGADRAPGAALFALGEDDILKFGAVFLADVWKITHGGSHAVWRRRGQVLSFSGGS